MGRVRQKGVIAAAGVVALDTMVERMAEGHASARKLAVEPGGVDGVSCDPDVNPTNLAFGDVTAGNPQEIVSKLDERGVRALSLPAGWRFVTHCGIISDDIDHAVDVIEDTFRGTRPSSDPPLRHWLSRSLWEGGAGWARRSPNLRTPPAKYSCTRRWGL